MGVRVDDAKDGRSTHTKAQHVEHHHVTQKFGNSFTRGTKRPTYVFSTTTTGRIAAETQAHPLNLIVRGELESHYQGNGEFC